MSTFDHAPRPRPGTLPTGNLHHGAHVALLIKRIFAVACEPTRTRVFFTALRSETDHRYKSPCNAVK